MVKRKADAIEPKEVIIGNIKAPVTLVMFGDYESRAVADANEWVKDVLSQYEGKVRFIFRHFPLRHIHQKAQKAAEAAVAAAQEGKFWEMHQKLLQNQKQLGTISLNKYAREIGITNSSFLNDLINGKYSWSVQNDLDEGLNLGIREIPSFIINGKKPESPVDKAALLKAIEFALEQHNTKGYRNA